MNRIRVLALCLVLGLLTACDDKKPPPPASEADASPRATFSIVASHPSDAGPPDAANEPQKEAKYDCTGDPKSAKTIGHTSVVFKLDLSTGKKAAFKPNAKKVKDRYRGELAAWELAKMLGIKDNVPFVCVRSFPAASLRSALVLGDGADAGPSLFDDQVIVEGLATKNDAGAVDGGAQAPQVKGAFIPWIDGLQFLDLEKDPLRSEAKEWLTAGKVLSEDNKSRARQISTMIVFDMLTGNWDRYSGGNVGLDKMGTTVLYIDNDAAFMEAPPKDALAKNKRMLEQTDRFSKLFVQRLRSFDVSRLQLRLEAAQLPKSVIDGVGARVKEALAIIEAKVTKNGEAETYYFP